MSIETMKTPTRSDGSPDRAGRRATAPFTISLDQTLRIVGANHDMLRLFGTGSNDVTGDHFCELLHLSIRRRVRTGLAALLTGERTRFHEPAVTMLTGDAVVVRGTLTAIGVSRDATRVEGIVVTVTPDGSEPVAAPRPSMSEMDVRVLEAVASGASTVQMASTMFLSRGGVEYHVAALLRRMKVKNRPALVSKAYSMGLFELGAWPPTVAGKHIRAGAGCS